MALDQVPNMQKDMRMKIMRNIGLACVKLNQFADAITSFEYIMSEKSDYRTALHLLGMKSDAINVSMSNTTKRLTPLQFAITLSATVRRCAKRFPSCWKCSRRCREWSRWLRRSRTKKTLCSQWSARRFATTDFVNSNATGSTNTIGASSPEPNCKAFIRSIETVRNQSISRIAPVIGDSFSQGYSWCVEQIRTAGHSDLANDIEINKVRPINTWRYLPIFVDRDS